MALWDRFRRSSSVASMEEKESRVAWMMALDSAGGRVVTVMGSDPANYAKDGYGKNAVVYRAIAEIARSIASVTPLVFKGDEEIEDEKHPLALLVKRPNVAQNWAAFVEAAVSFYMITGNSFMEKVIIGKNQLRELWVLRPDRVHVEKGPKGVPLRYVYKIGGQETAYDVDQSTGASKLTHWHTFHPLDDWMGLSPLAAAAECVDLWNATTTWNYNLLAKGGTPTIALKVEANKDGSFPKLTPQQKDQITTSFESKFSGPKGKRAIVLDGGLTMERLALSPKEMDWLQARHTSARDVCTALGFPAQLLGIPGDNTYSNYQEARLAFWEDTAIPLMLAFYSAVSNFVAEATGGAELRPDLDSIPALVRKRAETWDKVNASEFLTVNEKRVALGYEEHPDGDIIFVSAGKVPLDVASDPMAGMPAPDPNAIPIDEEDPEADPKQQAKPPAKQPPKQPTGKGREAYAAWLVKSHGLLPQDALAFAEVMLETQDRKRANGSAH